MKRAIARIAGATVLAGLLWAPAAHASTQVSVRIGVPGRVHARVVYGPAYRPVYRTVYRPVYRPVRVYAPVRYRYRYVRQPGYYYVRGYRHWVPGHWARGPYARRGW